MANPIKLTPTSVSNSQAVSPVTSTPAVMNSGNGEEPVYNENTIRNYLDYVNKISGNQYEGAKNSATDYKNQASKNLSSAQNNWNKMYNQNSAYLQQLQDESKRREQTITDTISNYYKNMQDENAKREAATLGAIDTAYGNIMSNAEDYLGNIMGTYNRSMGWANQGFEEGKQATGQARDEAIQLAQALYDMESEAQQRQTEKDLKSQYISYAKGMKNINQVLAASGINGGASETALLNALNGYEQNRTDIDEARLAALGALRQEQMKSDSAAQQQYLNALADLISQRTQNYLGIENTRSQGEYNYANMKNSAESERGSQTVAAQNNFQNWASEMQSNYANMSNTAQNNFQNWASDIVSQRASNNNSYAAAVAQLANDRNGVLQSYQNMYNQALNDRTSQALSQQQLISDLAERGIDYTIKNRTQNSTVAANAKNIVNGTSDKSYAKSSAEVQNKAVNSAYTSIINGKKKVSDLKDKDLRDAVKKKILDESKVNSKAKTAAKKNNLTTSTKKTNEKDTKKKISPVVTLN